MREVRGRGAAAPFTQPGTCLLATWWACTGEGGECILVRDEGLESVWGREGVHQHLSRTVYAARDLPAGYMVGVCR